MPAPQLTQDTAPPPPEGPGCFCARVHEAAARYAKPADASYAYGTAGFRMRAELMAPVAFRVGLLAALLSASHAGAVVGVVLTASHNPVEDNGIKLVCPDGCMLAEPAWEQAAVALANAPDAELPTLLLGLFPSAPGATARVAVGRDTRPSGPALLDALTAGVQALGPRASIIDLGLRTTPELHFAVDAINRGVWAGDDTYTAHLAAAFVAVLEGAPNGGCPRAPLVVDAANGIGARAMARLAAQLHATEHLRGWPIAVCNTDGVLNAGCGADFVKTGQCAPAGVASNTHSHFATLDGDADRLLYFFFDAGGAFRLLDGDRIAVLLALWLERLLAASGLRAALSLGIVQTAYANGAATSHCRDALHVDVALACTGVKHLHHVAAERFDIGIYFEANGHGTVLFGPRARTLIAAQGTPTLRALLRLVNPCVGDAISDLLVVEAALLHLGLTLDAWLALYTELPSRLLKVCVPDRAAYETCDADTRLTRPPHLQARIDALVHSVPQGRAFVRPSGTEDVVRVYAEAADTDACDQLAQAVAALLF